MQQKRYVINIRVGESRKGAFRKEGMEGGGRVKDEKNNEGYCAC